MEPEDRDIDDPIHDSEYDNLAIEGKNIRQTWFDEPFEWAEY